MKLDELLSYLKNNKEMFKIKFNIIKIGVFGSYA
jgi:predicted nucleotidyltransferase